MHRYRQELITLLHQYIDRLADGDVKRLCDFAEAMLAQRAGKRQQRARRFDAIMQHKESLRSNQ